MVDAARPRPPTRAADDPRAATLAAATEALRPLAALLLDAGIGAREAESLLRGAFVEAAARTLEEERGRPAPVSTIAMRADLPRSAVAARLRGRARAAERPAARAPLARLLERWHDDPEFARRPGRPRALAVRGAGGFAALVRRCSPDLYAPSVLEELERLRLVAVDRGRARPLARTLLPAGTESFERAGALAADVLEVLRRAALRPGDELAAGAFVETVDPRHLPRLRHQLRDRARTFLAGVQELLDAAVAAPGDAGVRLGVVLAGTGVGTPAVAAARSGEPRREREPAAAHEVRGPRQVPRAARRGSRVDGGRDG